MTFLRVRICSMSTTKGVDKIYMERGRSQGIRGDKFFTGPFNGAPPLFNLPYTGHKHFSDPQHNGVMSFFAQQFNGVMTIFLYIFVRFILFSQEILHFLM